MGREHEHLVLDHPNPGHPNQHNNFTEPLFQGTTNTNTVMLGLTSLCTMRCPNCNISVVQYKEQGIARHAQVEEIIRDAAHLQGLKRLHLTGGEPTMHPQFEHIVNNVRAWFGPQLLTIDTNGTGYRKYRHLFPLFDRVFITHYVKDAIYPGNFDNTEVIQEAEQDLGEKLIRETPVIHKRYHLSLAGEDQPCSKWFNPGLGAGWYNGLLYPCCVSFGIDISLGIPVTRNWREQIVNQPKGCSRCTYNGT